MTALMRLLAVICGCTNLLAAADDCHPSVSKPADATETQQQIGLIKQRLPDAEDRGIVLYTLAGLYAHLGQFDEALKSLRQAEQDRMWFDPIGDAGFSALRQCQPLQTIAAEVERAHPPVQHARIFKTVGPRDLIPEGIAADPVSGDLYLSSIHHRKILRLSPDGSVRDFISEGQDGALAILGVRIDPRDRSIWAASEENGRSILFHWERRGKLISRYPAESGQHLFNDPVVTRKGDVYVTDSLANAVYRLRNGQASFDTVILPQAFYPNGIALSSDEQTLYVSDAFSLFSVDTNTQKVERIAPPPGASIAGFDGLYTFRGTLVGVQNGAGAPRIMQLLLNENGRKVRSVKTLEFRSTLLDLPTTGAIYRNHFYYIVNSQVDNADGNKIKDPAKLNPVKIAVVPLPEK
jgi:SMP-30/Gluconolactonase/LRE-like region